MANRSALRFVLSIEPWRPVHLNQTSVCVLLRTRINPSQRLSGKLETNLRVREFYSAKRSQLNCTNNGTPSSSSQDDQGPPQEAVLKAISGFISETFNFISNFVCLDLSLMWMQRCLKQKEGSGKLRMWLLEERSQMIPPMNGSPWIRRY